MPCCLHNPSKAYQNLKQYKKYKKRVILKRLALKRFGLLYQIIFIRVIESKERERKRKLRYNKENKGK